eukprot:scaffold147492_cov45-Attheya_sp.AAC.1
MRIGLSVSAGNRSPLRRPALTLNPILIMEKKKKKKKKIALPIRFVCEKRRDMCCSELSCLASPELSGSSKEVGR